MKKSTKPEFYLIGDISWTSIREILIQLLENCKTSKQLSEVIQKMVMACGVSVEQIQENRKKLDIKPLTKDEIKYIKDMEKK